MHLELTPEDLQLRADSFRIRAKRTSDPVKATVCLAIAEAYETAATESKAKSQEVEEATLYYL
jgi:hypothetical protein